MRSKGARGGDPARTKTMIVKTRESKYRQQWGHSYNSHSQV